MYMGVCLHGYKYTICIQYPQRSEKGDRSPDSLELELRTAVSPHVGAGSQTWVLSKSSKQALLTTRLSLLLP